MDAKWLQRMLAARNQDKMEEKKESAAEVKERKERKDMTELPLSFDNFRD